jgi:hypothetical protein
MKAFPLVQPAPEIAPFYNHIADIIEASLNNYEKSNVHNIVVILKTMCEHKADYLDRYLPLMVKLVQKLSKDHLTPQRETPVADSADQLARMNAANPNKKLAKDTAQTLQLSISLVRFNNYRMKIIP